MQPSVCVTQGYIYTPKPPFSCKRIKKTFKNILSDDPDESWCRPSLIGREMGSSLRINV